MANLALTPTSLTGAASILNVTSAASAPGANTGITFTNDGTTFLVFINGSTASNATIKIAATVEGQAVTSIGPTAIPTTATSILGPFNADFSGGFGGTVEVDLSSTTGLSVLLCKPIGTH
jgi:hypothetical protein